MANWLRDVNRDLKLNCSFSRSDTPLAFCALLAELSLCVATELHGALFLLFCCCPDIHAHFVIAVAVAAMPPQMKDEIMDIDTPASGVSPLPESMSSQLPQFPSSEFCVSNGARVRVPIHSTADVQHATPQPPPTVRENFREIQVKVHVRTPGKDTWAYQGRGVVTQEIMGHESRVGASSCCCCRAKFV